MKKILLFIILAVFFFPRASRADEVRVVSLAPSVTEILFAIGLDENQIAGVTDYCDYPRAVSKILKVGSLTTVNIEKIISLKADYVFSVGSEGNPLNQRLKTAGLNTVIVNAESVEEIFSSISTIGRLVNRKTAADRLIGEMRSRLEKIKQKSQRIQNRKRVYIEIWDEPITSCGRGSLVDEVITKAGGINITGAIDALYPAVSQEFIIQQNPDVIILGYMARDQKGARTSVSRRFGWGNINALKYQDIISDIDPNMFLRPGPRIVDAIETIYNRLYEKR